MSEAHRLLSPHGFVRAASNVANCPELVLDPETKTTEGATPGSGFGLPFIIAIVGGANSGKTCLVNQFVKEFRRIGKTVSVLKEKNFTKPITIENPEDKANFIRDWDFDAPQAIDWTLMELGINMIKEKKPFNTPLYNPFQQKRLESTEKVLPAEFLVMEGRLLLHMEKIKRHINFSIYLDTDLDILLSRRIYKNLLDKQPLEEVIRRYREFVKKNHEHFVEPSKSKANVTIINYRSHQIDAMEGDEEEDNNILLIKMLAKAQNSENISSFPAQRKQSNVSNDEGKTPKHKEAPINPLYT